MPKKKLKYDVIACTELKSDTKKKLPSQIEIFINIAKIN